MNSITRTVLNWTGDKFNKLDPNDKHSTIKAVALGAIEGAIDGAVMVYPVLLAGCYYWKKKALDK